MKKGKIKQCNISFDTGFTVLYMVDGSAYVCREIKMLSDNFDLLKVANNYEVVFDIDEEGYLAFIVIYNESFDDRIEK